VLDLDLSLAAVEVAHHTGAHIGGANHQARRIAIDEMEIDEFREGLAQRRG
jgi:hypothetical protein